MANDRPDPREFMERAQRMLQELFGGTGDDEPWGEATRRSAAREPSPQEQRENLTFALATRAVEALEDLALNVAAIRQRLERLDGPTAGRGPGGTPGRSAGDPSSAPDTPDLG